MTLTQIRSLTTRKTGRNRRSMLEHLLRMEEEVVKEKTTLEVDKEKEKTKAIIQKYKTKNELHHPFTFEEIQEYLLTTAEKENENNVGEYTSALVKQIEGDSPLVIDLQGKTFNQLLLRLNTPRQITIQNVEGDNIGAYAGSHHGTANIHFKNINGNYTGCYAGSYQGNANIHFKNINGDHTGWGMGSYKGKATATFQNINGHWTGFRAGTDGNSTIIAYNSTGYKSFIEQKGILVLVNTNETPRIEGIDNIETRRQIQTLIAQKASPQEILDYIEANK